MSEHFIEKCRGCGTVISQCRCTSAIVKEERWSICPECQAKLDGGSRIPRTGNHPICSGNSRITCTPHCADYKECFGQQPTKSELVDSVAAEIATMPIGEFKESCDKLKEVLRSSASKSLAALNRLQDEEFNAGIDAALEYVKVFPGLLVVSRAKLSTAIAALKK